MTNVSEAHYTYKRDKPFVPLRLQKNYDPDGWLGALIGTTLYFDFSQPTKYNNSMRGLIKELGKHRNAALGKMTIKCRT